LLSFLAISAKDLQRFSLDIYEAKEFIKSCDILFPSLGCIHSKYKQ
jgi:hypothetical protein